MIKMLSVRNFIVVLFAYGLGAWLYCVPFVGDQKVYISTAKEMWERGSILHPYLMGETSYFKPPWLYWTILTGWKIFGFSLFGTFFFSLFATALTALILDSISIELMQYQEGTKERRFPLAGIWFAACSGTLTYGTSAQMEIWIVFFYSLAWFCFLKHFKSGQKKWLILGLIVSGVSALNKSPLYSVFSVLGYYSFLFLSPKSGWDGVKGSTPQKSPRSWFLKPSFYLANLIGIAVGLSWFVLMWFTDRERFWSHYVIQETLGKRGGNGGSLLHMWLDVLTFTFPFSLLLIPAFVRLPGLGKNRLIFLLSWSLIPAAFFSYFPYRTETYLYILIPSLALLLDWGLENCTSALLKWTAKINGVLVAGSMLGISALLGFTHLVSFSWIVLLVIVSIGFFITSWWLFLSSGKTNIKKLAFSSLGLIFAIRICAISLGENDIKDLRTITERLPERKLAFLDNGRNIWHEIGLLSVTTRNAAIRLHTTSDSLQALQNGAILVLNKDQAEALPLHNLPHLQHASWWRLQRSFTVPNLADLREIGDQKNRRELRLYWLQ